MGERTWHLKGRGLISRIRGCYSLQACLLYVMEEPSDSRVNHQMPFINSRWHFLLNNHRIFGLEGTLKDYLFQPPAISRDIFNEIRLLRTTSRLTLNISRDGSLTISLYNLFQHFITFSVKNFFLISRLNLSSPSLKQLLLVLLK